MSWYSLLKHVSLGSTVSESLQHSEPDCRCDRYRELVHNPFVVGDEVYLRNPIGRCDSEWSGPHRVTEVRSAVSVVLDEDGVLRHVSHLRFVPSRRPHSDDEVTLPDEASTPSAVVRRSSRVRRAPYWSDDYVLS